MGVVFGVSLSGILLSRILITRRRTGITLSTDSHMTGFIERRNRFYLRECRVRCADFEHGRVKATAGPAFKWRIGFPIKSPVSEGRKCSLPKKRKGGEFKTVQMLIVQMRDRYALA